MLHNFVAKKDAHVDKLIMNHVTCAQKPDPDPAANLDYEHHFKIYWFLEQMKSIFKIKYSFGFFAYFSAEIGKSLIISHQLTLEMEFKEFEPRFKSAKTRFKLSASLNLETFDTILSGTYHI